MNLVLMSGGLMGSLMSIRGSYMFPILFVIAMIAIGTAFYKQAWRELLIIILFSGIVFAFLWFGPDLFGQDGKATQAVSEAVDTVINMIVPFH